MKKYLGKLALGVMVLTSPIWAGLGCDKFQAYRKNSTETYMMGVSKSYISMYKNLEEGNIDEVKKMLKQGVSRNLENLRNIGNVEAATQELLEEIIKSSEEIIKD